MHIAESGTPLCKRATRVQDENEDKQGGKTVSRGVFDCSRAREVLDNAAVKRR